MKFMSCNFKGLNSRVSSYIDFEKWNEGTRTIMCECIFTQFTSPHLNIWYKLKFILLIDPWFGSMNDIKTRNTAPNFTLK